MPGTRRLVIEIAGDARGGVSAITEAEGATGRWGAAIGRLGQVAAVGFAAVGAGVAAAGVGLFNLGGSFDDAYDRIQVATGATGDQLAGLQDVFRNVVRDVPTDFGSASDAIAGLAQTLHLSGADLTGVSESVLELSRLTGTDLNTNVEASAHLFEQWGIPADRMTSHLDELLRASQATGVSVGDLEQQMVDNGAVLRDVGFDFEQSAALLGTLGRAGLSASDVMPGLSRAMANAAASGRSASDVFSETFAAIQNAPDDITASGAALEVFGARAGPRLAAMIREGQLSYQDLMGTIVDGDSTIAGTAAATNDFGEKWTLIKNRVLLALEPVATRVFDAVGTAMDRVGPIAARVAAWFSVHLPPAVARAQAVFASIVAWMQANWPQISATVSEVAEQVSSVVSTVVTYVQGAWDLFGSHILSVVSVVWNGIVEQIRGALEIVKGIIDVVMGIIHGDWSRVWAGIRGIVDGVWDMIVGRIRMAVGLVRELITTAWSAVAAVFGNAYHQVADPVVGAFDAVVGFVTGLPSRLRSAAGALWQWIPDAFRSAINAVVGVWNNFRFPSFTIPRVEFMGHGVGGGTIGGWQLPQMPYLAKGGVVLGPTLAMLGDNPLRREAIVPLERAGEFGFGGGGDRGGTTVVYVDNHGVIGSEAETERWLEGALSRMRPRGALRVIGINA